MRHLCLESLETEFRDNFDLSMEAYDLKRCSDLSICQPNVDAEIQTGVSLRRPLPHF